MVLVVEDGTGLATAESYVSVVTADAYHTKYGNTAWAGVESVKETALRRAALYMRSEYRARWRGARSKDLQALDWPRAEVTDTDGYAIASNVIPLAVKDSQCEAALRALTTNASLVVDEDTDAQKVTEESVTVGPIEVSASYAGTKATSKGYPIIESLLTGLLKFGVELRRA